MNTKLKEIKIDIKDFLLNPNNPRFAKNNDELLSEDKYVSNQEETFNKMLSKENRFDVPELAKNIQTNGFLGFDRLFVKKMQNKFLVIEGNRRIASIQYLIKKNKENPNRYEISSEIKDTFKNIPCIDLTGWEEEDINRILGLRHYDSVKDWRPLPGSYNLYSTYIDELAKKMNNDIFSQEFIYDYSIIQKIANIYSMKDSRVRSMILTYSIYLQIFDRYDPQINTDNIFSLISESLSSPIVKQRFEFNQNAGVFSSQGLDLFVELCLGKDGEDPVITEVSRGESTLRDYKWILQHGDESDIALVEEEKEITSNVKADIKSREMQRNLINTLKQISKELGNLNLNQIDISEITDRERETVEELQEMLNKLKGAAGGKL